MRYDTPIYFQKITPVVYGEIRQGSLSIQIQGHYADAFDRIRVGSRVYSVDDSRNLRTKQTFVVSEVQ